MGGEVEAGLRVEEGLGGSLRERESWGRAEAAGAAWGVSALSEQPRPPASALLPQLIFEVDAGGVAAAAAAVRATMEGVVRLEVPLAVNVKAGERWGSLADA